MGIDSPFPVRRFDRWSLQWRLGRAWKHGLSERRASHLRQARGFEGLCLDGIHRQHGHLVVDSELYLSDGRMLLISRSHVPTFDTLADVLREGPVRLERVADHRRFFGLYFQTCRGMLAMLADDLSVRGDGGGLRRSAPIPSFA